MLAGVGGIDAVVLVVAADESVMPQTREHFEICRLLGVPHGLVALTKTDLVDADTLELVAHGGARARRPDRSSAAAPIVPVSARTGEGLDALREALRGPGRRAAGRSDGAVRLPIDRVFSVKGFGTVVTGTLSPDGAASTKNWCCCPASDGEGPGGAGARRRGRRGAGGSARGRSTSAGSSWRTWAAATRSPRRAPSCPHGCSTPGSRSWPRARPLKHGARVRFHQGTGELLGRVGSASVRSARPASAGRSAGPRRGGAGRGGGLRAAAPGVAGRRVAGRPLHPPRLLAAGDHRRRRCPRPVPDRGAIRSPPRASASRGSTRTRTGLTRR